MNKPSKIAALLMGILLVVSIVGCANQSNASHVSSSEEASSNSSSASNASEYESLLFDTTRVHTIEVTMSDEDRADQLENPKDKTKYIADVVVDGEEFAGVKFHTKGNSSLYFMADAGRDKFSYGINFGKQADGLSYHGLDKLNLQNNFVDATFMREYLSYWLFRKMGIDAPLASYVRLTINGEDQGLYTALEDVDVSYLQRIGKAEGTIYKPEASGLALDDEELERLMAGNSAAHEGSAGADLAYIDDSEESYPEIFDNAQTREDDGTRARVIEALKALSEQSDLEAHLDINEIIGYFSVHNYLVNYDSYTGLMLHNYCLYEADGKLAMLPWDYDSAFGSFPANAMVGSPIDSTSVVNVGIDSPIAVVPDQARPMWNWILSDDSYVDAYHDALSRLVGVIDSYEFEAEAKRVHDLILPQLETDPKAVYTPDEFENAYATVIELSRLRAESVQKQLDGQLASRTEDQAEQDKVEALAVRIADLGSIENL